MQGHFSFTETTMNHKNELNLNAPARPANLPRAGRLAPRLAEQYLDALGQSWPARLALWALRLIVFFLPG